MKNSSVMTRRGLIATAGALILVPGMAVAKTVKVNSGQKLKLGSGTVYEFTGGADVAREIILGFGNKEMSLADYIAQMEKTSGNKTNYRQPIYLTSDPSLLPRISDEMLGKIRELNDWGHVSSNATTTISEYFCALLYYSCRTTTS